MKKIIIPALEKGRCSHGCVFRVSNEMGAECVLGTGTDVHGKVWELTPGPDCPGPGAYKLMKEEKRVDCREDAVIFRKEGA